MSSNVDANIRRYWERVEQDDLDAGQSAYPSYAVMMHRLSKHYGTLFIPTVEAFVALSPNSDYFGNLRSLVSVIVGMKEDRPFTISTFKVCGTRAKSYLDGTVSFVDTVKGKKITAFRHNILYQSKSDQFVVDGHMIAIALGTNMTTAEANLALRDHKYDSLANSYRKFARAVALPPHELQATLWHCRKRTEGIKFSTQRDMWRDDAHLLYDVTEILPYRIKEPEIVTAEAS